MIISQSLLDILAKADENCPLNRQECRRLLSFEERSLEAGVLMAAADHISRRRFDNNAVLLGQIGIETGACPGRCKFCAFGGGHSLFERSQLSLEQILARALAFSEQPPMRPEGAPDDA